MSKISRLVFLGVFQVVLMSANAYAARTPDTQAPSLPACPKEYVATFVQTYQILNKAIASVRTEQIPPNTREALTACREIFAKYPMMSCNVIAPDTGVAQNLATSFFKNFCDQFPSWLKSKGVDPENPRLPQKKVTEETLVTEIEPYRISLRVLSSAKVQKMLDEPRAILAINGELLDIHEAVNRDGESLCALDRERTRKVTVNDGDTRKIKANEAGSISGFAMTRLLAEDDEFMMDCAKDGATGLTLRELRQILRGILAVEIETDPLAPEAPAQ